MTMMQIRGVSLFVKVTGQGYPLALMHGGPSADYTTLLSLRSLRKDFKLVFYDHRCNGRSVGMDITSMTMDNLTADADALRQALGFDKWAVLGHSFGGNVALEYALRFPQNLSHLILINTGADFYWPREHGPQLLEQRGFSPEIVEIARRHFSGEVEPEEVFPNLMKLGKAYSPSTSLKRLPAMLWIGAHTKLRPEALIFGETQVLKDWRVIERLGEIKVPTLIIAGREDFVYPPEAQQELLAGLPHAQLEFIDGAGHNPQMEQPAAVIRLIREFLAEVSSGSS